MKSSDITLATCAALVSLSVAVLCGCRADKSEEIIPEKKTQAAVRRVASGSLAEIITATGEVTPFSSVLFASKAPGRLEQLAITDEEGNTVPLAEGMRVRKGQQLAVIDRAVYLAQARRAEAAEQSARVQYEESLREENRMTALFEEGAATEQMRDKSAAARAMSEAALWQAEAALELARIELAESTPVSPIDGIIVAKHIDEGNIVASGAPIATIQDISKVKIIFNVPDRYLHRIVPGRTKVVLTADALEGAVIDALVNRVYPTLEKATRTLPVEVLVDNSDGGLAPGMFVRVSVEIEKRDDVPIVRDSELVKTDDRTCVYLVRNSTIHCRPVRLGISEDDRYEVLEGLEPGDLIVTRGQGGLEEGEEVDITREESE